MNGTAPDAVAAKRHRRRKKNAGGGVAFVLRTASESRDVHGVADPVNFFAPLAPFRGQSLPSFSRAKIPAHRRGFTLLEVMLAVAIIGFTTVGIFRFVQSTVRNVAVSVEDTEEQLRVDRLVALVQEEFYSLPAHGQTNIQGESIKLNGADFDSIEWRSRGGPGLMTTAASGEYRVKLRIQPITKDSNKYEIGYWRRPALLETSGGLVAGGSDKDATWVPLLQRVSALRIRYWDSRLGSNCFLKKHLNPSSLK